MDSDLPTALAYHHVLFVKIKTKEGVRRDFTNLAELAQCLYPSESIMKTESTQRMENRGNLIPRIVYTVKEEPQSHQGIERHLENSDSWKLLLCHPVAGWTKQEVLSLVPHSQSDLGKACHQWSWPVKDLATGTQSLVVLPKEEVASNGILPTSTASYLFPH